MTIEYLDLGEGVPRAQVEPNFEAFVEAQPPDGWASLPEGVTIRDEHPGRYSFHIGVFPDGTGQVQVQDRTGERASVKRDMLIISRGVGALPLDESNPVVPLIDRTGESADTIRFFGLVRYQPGPPASAE